MRKPEAGLSVQVRPHVDGHAGRDGQSRLQPGRERRVPGGGEPALPGLLFGEAAVLHAGVRRLQAGGRWQWRREHAGGRSYTADRGIPIAGAKVTGTVGRFTFGTLNASDEAPGKLAAEDDSPGAGRNRQFNIGRVQYGLGPSSFVGAIVTDVRFAGDDNHVVGGDLNLKLSETQRVSGMLLQSWSDRRGDTSQGVATQVNYSHNTQRSSQSAQFEHYYPEFAMDTAFYTRVGFTSGWGYVDYNVDPDKTKYPWVHRISPFTFLQRANDRIQRGDELTSVTGVRIAFTRQGFFRIDGTFGQEPWAGDEYPVRRLRTFGYVQLFRWLQANGSFVNGYAIYYDPDNPFAGRDHSLNVGLTLQPTGRLRPKMSGTARRSSIVRMTGAWSMTSTSSTAVQRISSRGSSSSEARWITTAHVPRY